VPTVTVREMDKPVATPTRGKKGSLFGDRATGRAPVLRFNAKETVARLADFVSDDILRTGGMKPPFAGRRGEGWREKVERGMAGGGSVGEVHHLTDG